MWIFEFFLFLIHTNKKKKNKKFIFILGRIFDANLNLYIHNKWQSYSQAKISVKYHTPNINASCLPHKVTKIISLFLSFPLISLVLQENIKIMRMYTTPIWTRDTGRYRIAFWIDLSLSVHVSVCAFDLDKIFELF